MLEVVALQPQFWIVPLIGLIFILLGALFFGLERRPYGDEGWMIGAVVCWVIGVVFALVWVGISIPFDSKYHTLYKISGTVESVTNTLESGGDGERTMTPVVKLSGYDNPIEMDTPRIVTLKGREVELVCTLGWVYQGLDTTNCNIAAIK